MNTYIFEVLFGSKTNIFSFCFFPQHNNRTLAKRKESTGWYWIGFNNIFPHHQFIGNFQRHQLCKKENGYFSLIFLYFKIKTQCVNISIPKRKTVLYLLKYLLKNFSVLFILVQTCCRMWWNLSWWQLISLTAFMRKLCCK